MFWRLLVAVGCLSVSAYALSFPCYVTLAKDSCWTNYEVSVNVIDAETNKQLITITIPKGKSWARDSFVCQPGQKLMYHATFSPIFWQNDTNKTYMALSYLMLPTTISKEDTAWNIPVCYPEAFSAVPFPPNAGGNCTCDFASIPPIKP